MAKSIFINGTRVLSKWLNSIYGGGAKDTWAAATVYAAGDVIKLSGGEILRAISVTGDFMSGSTEPTAPAYLRETVVDNHVTWERFGGHLHDSLTIDGSAPKIHPVHEIWGASEGSLNMVFPVGVFSAEQTVAVRWRKDSDLISGAGAPTLVTLFINHIYETSNGVTFLATGTPLYSAGVYNLRPANLISIPITVRDDSDWCSGSMVIGTDGSVDIRLFATESGDANSKSIEQSGLWTASGTKGFPPLVVQYPIWP